MGFNLTFSRPLRDVQEIYVTLSYIARQQLFLMTTFPRRAENEFQLVCDQVDELRIAILFSGLRKVYPYYFTFTTFTKGRWVGEKILDVFSREFRAHPAEEYVRK
jgi:hypothetical protein